MVEAETPGADTKSKTPAAGEKDTSDRPQKQGKSQRNENAPREDDVDKSGDTNGASVKEQRDQSSRQNRGRRQPNRQDDSKKNY